MHFNIHHNLISKITICRDDIVENPQYQLPPSITALVLSIPKPPIEMQAHPKMTIAVLVNNKTQIEQDLNLPKCLQLLPK